MVIYNTPTVLSGCGLCGADDGSTLHPEELEPASIPTFTQPQTSFDLAVKATLKPIPSWAIGLGIGAVALGVVGAVYAISRNV